MAVQFLNVRSFDGATLVSETGVYEMGNFLGSGAAGTVYEATRRDSQQSVAVKILNPIGYKLAPPQLIQRCQVLHTGLPLSAAVVAGRAPFTAEHVCWLYDANARQLVTAFQDPRAGGVLRELPLPKCVAAWGLSPPELAVAATTAGDAVVAVGGDSHALSSQPGVWKQVRLPSGKTVALPRVPPKYIKWLRARALVYREIRVMCALGRHENVLALHEVLELVQDSKSTLFLVLEMAAGGELFDRIRADHEGAAAAAAALDPQDQPPIDYTATTRCAPPPPGTMTEASARRWMRQLLAGVAYCHDRGVVHRDLKPENLLLADDANGGLPRLKIADFGLSALAAVAGEASAIAAAPPAPIIPVTPALGAVTPSAVATPASPVAAPATGASVGSSRASPSRLARPMSALSLSRAASVSPPLPSTLGRTTPGTEGQLQQQLQQLQTGLPITPRLPAAGLNAAPFLTLGAAPPANVLAALASAAADASPGGALAGIPPLCSPLPVAARSPPVASPASSGCALVLPLTSISLLLKSSQGGSGSGSCGAGALSPVDASSSGDISSLVHASAGAAAPSTAFCTPLRASSQQPLASPTGHSHEWAAANAATAAAPSSVGAPGASSDDRTCATPMTPCDTPSSSAGAGAWGDAASVNANVPQVAPLSPPAPLALMAQKQHQRLQHVVDGREGGGGAAQTEAMPPPPRAIPQPPPPSTSAVPMHRLRSVVGSPHYCAPEIIAAGSAAAAAAVAAAAGGGGETPLSPDSAVAAAAASYDGPKADAWSVGVILHAMLAGGLPFAEDIGGCARFAQYAAWVRARDTAALEEAAAAAAHAAAVQRVHTLNAAKAARRAERKRGRRAATSTGKSASRQPASAPCSAAAGGGSGAVSVSAESRGTALASKTRLKRSPADERTDAASDEGGGSAPRGALPVQTTSRVDSGGSNGSSVVTEGGGRSSGGSSCNSPPLGVTADAAGLYASGGGGSSSLAPEDRIRLKQQQFAASLSRGGTRRGGGGSSSSRVGNAASSSSPAARDQAQRRRHGAQEGGEQPSPQQQQRGGQQQQQQAQEGQLAPAPSPRSARGVAFCPSCGGPAASSSSASSRQLLLLLAPPIPPSPPSSSIPPASLPSPGVSPSNALRHHAAPPPGTCSRCTTTAGATATPRGFHTTHTRQQTPSDIAADRALAESLQTRLNEEAAAVASFATDWGGSSCDAPETRAATAERAKRQAWEAAVGQQAALALALEQEEEEAAEAAAAQRAVRAALSRDSAPRVSGCAPPAVRSPAAEQQRGLAVALQQKGGSGSSSAGRQAVRPLALGDNSDDRALLLHEGSSADEEAAAALESSRGAHGRLRSASAASSVGAASSAGSGSSAAEDSGASTPPHAPPSPPPPAAVPAASSAFPAWFFPPHLSAGAKAVLAGLLHPDPTARLSIHDALAQDWLRGGAGGSPESPDCVDD